MNDYDNLLDSYCSQVCSQFKKHKELCQQVIDIKDTASVIAKDAHLYDFPGVKCNGFRFAVKTVLMLFRLIPQRYQSTPDRDLINLVSVMHASLPYFRRVHEETSKLPLNHNGTRSILYEDYQMVMEVFQAFIESDAMDVMCNSLCAFHLPKPDGPVMKLFCTFVVPLTQYSNVWTGLASLFNYTERQQAWRNAFSNFKIDYLKKIDFIANSFFVRKICPLLVVSLSEPNICREIFIPRQQQVKISVDIAAGQAELLRLSPNRTYSSSTVRCRLLMQIPDSVTELPEERPVVFHVHGGGFVIGSADNHEMYTRHWARDLPPGTAFISVDYALAPDFMFPDQLQQCLDVFLWCNDSEFRETIGYKPNKFIFVGDSSGGIKLLGLAAVLCDMEKKYPDISFMYPSAMVAIYPSFCVTPFALPSMLMAALHPELSPPAFLTMQSACVPFSKDQSKINYEQLTWGKLMNWLTPWPIRTLLGLDNSKGEDNNNYGTWWNEGLERSMKQLQNWPLLKHPYASPLFYDDFERLSRMHLSLFPIESDPILDHSICLANKWQGSVSLKVIDDSTHAFLVLADAAFLDVGSRFAKHRDEISKNIAQLARGDEI